MMLNLIPTLLCFAGFCYAANRLLKIKLSHSPLFSISFIGVVLYLSALSGYLREGAWLLMGTGGIFSIIFLAVLLKEYRITNQLQVPDIVWLFTALALVSFLLSLNMAFTVIDDYVYWGIIGKYLFLYDQLPGAGNPLDTRILAYTPGTALVHYFFYLLPGKYSSDISYFAQGLTLICTLFVVGKKENFKETTAFIGILIVLLTLFFGSIFTKLQVDYLLAAFVFAIFWVWVSEVPLYKRLLTLSMPVCFLFLIKEIGFAIALAVLFAMALDLAVTRFSNKKDKIIALTLAGLIALLVFAVKQLWVNHVSAMGFVEFHSAVNRTSITRALNIFTDSQVRSALIIFIKEVFFGSADRLNIPYIIWYAIIGFGGYKVFKSAEADRKIRFKVFCRAGLAITVIYLFMLYCMQIIMFNVGKSFDHAIGFSRYFNILFAPVILITTAFFFNSRLPGSRLVIKRISVVVSVIVLIVLAASRVEVSLHREKQDLEVEEVSARIAAQINGGNHSIGIVSTRKDNLANLQFLYYLLPNRVDYLGLRYKTRDDVINYIREQDYMIFYHPDPELYEWLAPYFLDKRSGNPSPPAVNLMKIHKDLSTLPKRSFMLEQVDLKKGVLND